MKEEKKKSMRFRGWYCAINTDKNNTLCLKRGERSLMEIPAEVVYNAPAHILFESDNCYDFYDCLSLEERDGENNYWYMLDMAKEDMMGFQINFLCRIGLFILDPTMDESRHKDYWKAFVIPQLQDYEKIKTDMYLDHTTFEASEVEKIDVGPLFEVFET